ncbi:hypothetical protein GGR21_001297 [Dysgonomonas hofstadii]|uniref:DUF2846 domain-containing protein n=1 Tax=Dysgonomonas hofstadii TaxID=637886 RepID=A0A840CPC8_9BACT|nr:hypothetical protein [Dysgonomonas hofstadii]MBB4035404.1 hypothetical protein [Dysgonomonas hofstadii]
MRNILFLLLILFSLQIYSQEEIQVQATDIMVKPGRGKCIVYFARRETAALLAKFSVYDGDLFLGKLGAKKYFVYECDPGEHVFIAKGENTFYVDANLEEGKIYVIDMKIKTGIISARVGLVALDSSNKKYEKEKRKFIEFINKKEGELLLGEDIKETDDTNEEDISSADSMSNRLKKFHEMKQKGKKITAISPSMNFD